MSSLLKCGAVALCCVAIGLGAGCNKKPVEDPTVVEGAATLPGVTNIWKAIDKKDYDGAMAALFKVRESCNTPEKEIQFLVLSKQVRDKMTEAAPTNPSAAQAAQALRSLAVGAR